MIDSVLSAEEPPSGKLVTAIVMPEVIAFRLLSLNVPILLKTFSPFAPVPVEVVYFTSTTSPLARFLPIIPSPNRTSGISYSLSSKKTL